MDTAAQHACLRWLFFLLDAIGYLAWHLRTFRIPSLRQIRREPARDAGTRADGGRHARSNTGCTLETAGRCRVGALAKVTAAAGFDSAGHIAVVRLSFVATFGFRLQIESAEKSPVCHTPTESACDTKVRCWFGCFGALASWRSLMWRWAAVFSKSIWTFRLSSGRPPTPSSRPPTPSSGTPTPSSRPPTPSSRPPTPSSRPPTPSSRTPTPSSRAPTPSS